MPTEAPSTQHDYTDPERLFTIAQSRGTDPAVKMVAAPGSVTRCLPGRRGGQSHANPRCQRGCSGRAASTIWCVTRSQPAAATHRCRPVPSTWVTKPAGGSHTIQVFCMARLPRVADLLGPAAAPMASNHAPRTPPRPGLAVGRSARARRNGNVDVRGDHRRLRWLDDVHGFVVSRIDHRSRSYARRGRPARHHHPPDA